MPDTPAKLRWAPDIPIEYVDVSGNKLRYIRTGSRPKRRIAAYLRTQLDLFEKVIPELAKDFGDGHWLGTLYGAVGIRSAS